MTELEGLGLDEINRRLAEIDELLDDEVREPSSEHYELLKERDALRNRAAQFSSSRDSRRTSDELRSELDSLRRGLKAELASHTGYVTSKGGGSHSATPGAWVKLAAQSRAGSEIDRLNARIAQIEAELERREDGD